MIKLNTRTSNENSELNMDEMDIASGGAIEIREVVIKAVVVQNPPPPSPAPTPVPYPNLRIRF